MKRITSRSTHCPCDLCMTSTLLFSDWTSRVRAETCKGIVKCIIHFCMFPVFVVLHRTILLERLSITRVMNWNLAPCLKYGYHYWWHWNGVSFHPFTMLLMMMICIGLWVNDSPASLNWFAFCGSGGSLHSEMDGDIWRYCRKALSTKIPREISLAMQWIRGRRRQSLPSPSHLKHGGRYTK